MTTQFEGIKTNEFLRRRKLRLQQVREQSKDIAKKIRQRANVEKLRQANQLDSKKEQEYLQRQEKLVKHLEVLYSKGIKSFGAGHQDAVDLTQVSPEKPDLSKQRGREAAAELRKKKQAVLDEQKKLLDRKLQAREIANELSRDKSNSVANKILSKATTTSNVNDQSKEKASNDDNADQEGVTHIDMATQWELDAVPNEWDPCVPALSLPKDDSEKESFNINNAERNSDKSRRVDLFALSEEMPSSLRGGLTNIPEERATVRPSFTQVSEYLQNRGLRLRETDKVSKPTGDLQSLKQTIMRTRPSKNEGSISNDVCHVLDEQIIPVPCWQAESNCHFCSHKISQHYGTTEITVTNSQINKIFSSIRSTRDYQPSPILRGSSPFRRNKVPEKLPARNKSREKSPTSLSNLSGLAKKSSVTVYNHSTRDSRNIPCGDERLVVPNTHKDEDAYAQAMKEVSTNDAKEREHQRRLQEMRSKIAMTKQSVEKEYNETLSFLNSMPKEKPSKAVKTAFMDERCEKMLKDSRQHKMQQEFRKIEKECRKHGPQNCQRRSSSASHQCRSKSPDNESISRDFQYSWMPVPESDGSLAIHTIPNAKPKSGNSVKFSKVDSYHEYRSRHKHTPPTKEKDQDKPKTVVETVLIENDSESSDTSTDTSSVENLSLSSNKKKHETLTEAERIIVYKILESKKKNKAKKHAKMISSIAKSLHSINKDKTSNEESKDKERQSEENGVSFEHIQEGIYKTTKEKGDNVSSLYFTDNAGEGHPVTLTRDEVRHGRPCHCSLLNANQQRDKGTDIRWQKGDRDSVQDCVKDCCNLCKCSCTSKAVDSVPPAPQPSAATSIASFKTATNDKEIPAPPEGGVVHLLDDEGQEAGKFYIGASGFLKDDDYEVIIQLRKKDSAKQENKPESQNDDNLNTVEEMNKETKTVANSENDKEDVSVDDPKNKPVDVDKDASHAVPDDTPKEETHVTRKPSEELTSNNQERIVSGSNINDEELKEKNYSDKSVCTSFQLPYAIESHVPKLDASPKPSASTYTQTTFNSTNIRPAYIHMSSSTSTAYMSPPEVVLPRYLRHDSDDDANKDYNSDFGRFEKHYDDCTCDNCFTRKTNGGTSILKPAKKKTNIPTPPNTIRSSTSGKNNSNKSQNVKLRRKCKRCVESGKSHKPVEHKSSRHDTDKKRKVLPKHTLSSAASSSKHVWNFNRKLKDNNISFNPIIKKYVNKLLTLNREGVKVLEVVDQECSTVATPGSSIIDVPRNMVNKKPGPQPKLSLEQIKNELIKKMLSEYVSKNNQTEEEDRGQQNHIHIKVSAPHLVRKRVHKVKSLNISRRILKNKKTTAVTTKSASTITDNDIAPPPPVPRPSEKVKGSPSINKEKVRSKSSPTPRQIVESEYKGKNYASDIDTKTAKKSTKTDLKSKHQDSTDSKRSSGKPFFMPQHRASTAALDLHRLDTTPSLKDIPINMEKLEVPIAVSTQTSIHITSESNYVKLAENKLVNMEKIADLTEKCTQRLSNLAKVLEQVRKNKSLAYSQISASDSASTELSDKNNVNSSSQSIDLPDAQENLEPKPSTPMLSTSESGDSEKLDSPKYVSFLTDIPKPSFAISMPSDREVASENTEINITKTRTKPPPALSRMHLRHVQGVIPHELSTVVEVDSPMSVRLKNQSSLTENRGSKDSIGTNSNSNKDISPNRNQFDNNKEGNITNPDLLQSNLTLAAKLQQKRPTTDSSDESKLQMMDLKQFNEIMLQPFISIQEYAKQYDVGTMDEASNIGDVLKDDGANEDLSSMQSDGSLPDVIAELLKRKVITEPFKFDTVSNVHSTTGSSESSVLALSKIRKDIKKASVMFQDKENVAESSDTLSFSSNPDLEHAFKKLGMGWASSTLKKTKERLALSSSTNTSSSSVSQFKPKNFNNQEVPALVTDISSVLQLTKKEEREKRDSKNNAQQTNLVQSMTVKEFLTQELADKITFTHRSRRNDTEEEFVSLFETKMPEEMKHSSQVIGEERSIDSGLGNRARTSTPVQIFKSMTYHSSSSSNMSNGLFSNADDLSSVKVTSNSIRNHSTSDKDDLTIPNCSLRIKKASDASKSD